jgi:16S rRNA (cytosine1402-N4)-methyltransferase
MSFRHISVMPEEVEEFLECQPGRIYVDGTVGGAGHAEDICRKILPDGLLIGIDQDADAIENARIRLSPYASVVKLFQRNFIDLPDILSHLNISAVDGILLDLGLSLHQLEESGRGFSFMRSEPLDMRMNLNADRRAADLVNDLDENQLARLFRRYGEEHRAGPIARSIVRERRRQPIQTSLALAEIIKKAAPQKPGKKHRIHPATKVFQALRIAVNQEIERLEGFMAVVFDYLNPRGRLCVISFHSLEDRIVKQRIRELEKGCTCPPDFPVCACGKKPQVRSLHRKVVRPRAEEIARNPMARSAKLRAAEKR